LEIFPGSLKYDPNAIYEFRIETTHMGKTFNQIVRITIDIAGSIPIVSLGCRFPKACFPDSTYLKINPSSQLIIDGRCVEGCYSNDVVQYTFTIYEDIYGNSTWLLYIDQANQILGAQTNELTLSSSLFLSNPTIAFWRVEFRTTVNQIVSGQSSIVLKINQLPYNGYCYVDKSSGISLSDYFHIRCENWLDPDGTIQTYEFFGKSFCLRTISKQKYT
jgi:hypothetical protein